METRRNDHYSFTCAFGTRYGKNDLIFNVIKTTTTVSETRNLVFQKNHKFAIFMPYPRTELISRKFLQYDYYKDKTRNRPVMSLSTKLSLSSERVINNPWPMTLQPQVIKYNYIIRTTAKNSALVVYHENPNYGFLYTTISYRSHS